MEMILNTVRKIDHDQAKEHSLGDDKSMKENLAIGFLNPEDFNRLKFSSTKNIKITSEFGTIILKAKQQEKVPKASLYVPVSIWANQLTGIIDNELIYKNIKVNIEPSEESILNFNELMKTIK